MNIRLILAVSALASLLALFISPSLRAAEEGVALRVSVPGMTCGNCALSVSKELKKLKHVTAVHVDPVAKVALIATSKAEAPDEKSVLKAVQKAGYRGESFGKAKGSFAEAKAALASRKG